MLMFVFFLVAVTASGVHSNYWLTSNNNNTVLSDPGDGLIKFSFSLRSTHPYGPIFSLGQRNSQRKEDKTYYRVSSGRYNFNVKKYTFQTHITFRVTLELRGLFKEHEWYSINPGGRKTIFINFEVAGTDEGLSSSQVSSYLAGPLVGTAVGIIIGICVCLCRRRRRRKSRSASRNQLLARTRQQGSRDRVASTRETGNNANAPRHVSGNQTTINGNSNSTANSSQIANVLYAQPPPAYGSIASPGQHDNVGFTHDNPPPYHIATRLSSDPNNGIPLQELKVDDLPERNPELPSYESVVTDYRPRRGESGTWTMGTRDVNSGHT